MNNAMMYQNSRRKENCDTWRVGIYCRLSKDDELNGESASISNQRDILTNYCNSQGWQIVGVFQDDGYTGLNTERPDLQRLLQACEKGLVNLVITKDQSRLGRNHVQTGYLMEEFFPKHGVRYVALYDNVDTYAEDNEIAPFKNVLNEMYSRDISKKVHASYHLQATKGKFTGVVPPLGYLKDPDEKGHLLIDEETAPIVRKIFQWAVDGRGINYISRELERQKVPCPSWWHRKRGNRTYYTKWEQKDRLESLDRLIARLYDDLISEKISEATFDKMLEKTQKEQSEIKQELVKNQKLLDAEEKLDAQSQQWAEDIGSYTDITELDANILNRLISKIVISEPQDDESNNSHAVEMEIHFNLSPIPELGTIERGSSSIRYF